MIEKENFGILTTINWNSNSWAAPSTDEDRQHSNFSYVRYHDYTHEDLNFGHHRYPAEEDGHYVAYVPQFEDRGPATDKVRDIKIVFFKSQDPIGKGHFLIGMYGQPQIGYREREADHEIFRTYDYGFISSLVKDITLFDSPLLINENDWRRKRFLPSGKKLGQQGWNYLTTENVRKLLDELAQLNPENKVLQKFRLKLLTNQLG